MQSLSQLSEEFKNIKEEYNYQYCVHILMAIDDIIHAAKKEKMWQLDSLIIQHYSDFNEPDMGLGLYSSIKFKNKDKEFTLELQSHDNDNLSLSPNMFNQELEQAISQYHENFFTNKHFDIVKALANKFMQIHLARKHKINQSSHTEYNLTIPINESHKYLLGETYYARYEKEQLESNLVNTKSVAKKLKV
jgi:hypothetical protein